MDKPKLLESKFNEEINFSEEWISNSVTISTEKTNFYSSGKVYAAVGSPYIKNFEKIEIKISTNGQTYKKIPIYNNRLRKGDKNKMKEIGHIDLTQMHNKLYSKTLIPPRLEIPENVDKGKILDSVQISVAIEDKLKIRGWFEVKDYPEIYL